MTRSDAQRNREKILAAARSAFAEASEPISMAELARRADVGMATLYRNFPSRREVLEALFADEVDALLAAAEHTTLLPWLRRFFAFSRVSARSARSCSTSRTTTPPCSSTAATG